MSDPKPFPEPSTIQVNGASFVPTISGKRASSAKGHLLTTYLDESHNHNKQDNGTNEVVPRVVDEKNTAKEDIPLIGGAVGATELKDEDITMMMHSVILVSIAGVSYFVGRGINAIVGFVV